MSDDISLTERLAGFVPDDPTPPGYAVPAQNAWPPDVHRPSWSFAPSPPPAAVPTQPVAPPAWVAPARPGHADPTVVFDGPARRLAATPSWEAEERRGMRVAVLMASVALLLGAGAAVLILARGTRPTVDIAAPDGVPAPVGGETPTLPPLEIGGQPPLAQAGIVPVPASVAPVTAPPSTSTTRRPGTTAKPPVSRAVLASPQITLNPPNPPVRPTRPPATSTSSTAPTTTTSTTRPAPTTTSTTAKPQR